MMENPNLRRLERYLDLAAARQTIVASNLANVDTPGYRTRDLDFNAELRRAETHLTSDAARPVVREVEGLTERPDGNNVSLERESMLLAQTQLQFRLGVQLLRAELRRVQLAITEGRG
ncbi:MAG: flagellar basal body rod protein FlgB [Acidobacteria bacterium]|nr:flagellar basal body rod protein FlgB [Acidobacteriota bacterium]MBI3663016.1 flagellar basal body rod protein FlgB [Acidobacteriota bacterium]